MRTHIDIDDDVLNQVQKLGNFSTKKAAIPAALNDYLDGLKRQKLLALRGKVEWIGDLDALRANRSSSSASAP